MSIICLVISVDLVAKYNIETIIHIQHITTCPITLQSVLVDLNNKLCTVELHITIQIE